ncbi:MAG: SAM-dependent methyltransferase [Caulobacterales bacterium]
MTTLQQRLIAQIAIDGPMSVAQFMTHALYDPEGGYYARNADIGGTGDFTTSPEISQMFGELIGLWCVHEWEQIGKPDPFNLIELGPGNGVLMSDAWRAAKLSPAFRKAARIHMLEIGEGLRRKQSASLANVGAKATWHERFEDIPAGPSIIVANEFFDCLPIRQFVRRDGQWRERLLGRDDEGELTFGLASDIALLSAAIIPPTLADAEDGAIAEIAPALPTWIDLIAARFHAAPSRALIIDYGGDGAGDTLQAMRAHEKSYVLDDIGIADLTAHVDFGAIKRLARASGLAVADAIPQRDFLRALGLDQRTHALAQQHPEITEQLGRDYQRLTAPDQMGDLFKATCLSSPNLPPPAGF